MDKTIELPPATRSAGEEQGLILRAASFDLEANTVEVVWTTGAVVRRYSWEARGHVDEELVVSADAVRLDRLNAGAPFLNTHGTWDLSDVIGSVVPGTARIEKGRGLALVRLSRAPAHADIVQNIQDEIIRNVSVGYRYHAIEKIEGKEGSVPRWRVIDWEPFEISAVPIGADPGAQTRADDKALVRFPCRMIVSDQPTIAATRMRMRAAARNPLHAD